MRKLDRLGLVLGEGRAILQEAGIESAALDARLLLQAAVDLEHGDLLVSLDRVPMEVELALYASYIARRMKHEPVSRILGYREFYGREFGINTHVLDPRPDTETLIDLALAKRGDDEANTIVDLGAGSGAIIVTLLAERPQWSGLALDCSPDALEVTLANAESHGVADRLTTLATSWWQDVAGRFDLIVSNPPYIPKAEIDTLSPDVKNYDPHLALAGGKDGLDAYRAVAMGADQHLKQGGLVLLEIGAGQQQEVVGIWAKHNFKLIDSRQDLGGHVRALAFSRA